MQLPHVKLPHVKLRPMQLLASDLGCERAGRRVFTGLHFALGPGRALAVTGPNGVGKSSLLRLLAGLIEPASGTLRLEGASAERSLPEEAHYIGHRDALKPALSPREILTFWRAMLGRPLREPGEALDIMGLGHAADLPSGCLSAGQRRRLALSRLLVSGRPVWLLDEPTSALDTSTQELFATLARAHLEGGGLVLAATHAPLGFETETLNLASPR